MKKLMVVLLALVIASNNIRLVSRLATQIIFVDTRQIYRFDSWRSLLDCKEKTVGDFLQQYQDYYGPLFHADT